MRTNQSFGCVGIAFLLSALLAGCAEPISTEYFYQENFLSQCDGLPCGWQQLGGSPGDATYVPTFHQSQPGLKLLGNEAELVAPAGESSTLDVVEAKIEIRLAAACDPGESIFIQAVLVEEGEGGTTEVFTGRVTPSTDFSGESVSELTAGAFNVMGNKFSTSGRVEARVESITISKNLRGQCVIARLVVDQIGQTGF